jgi:uncharacterized membrane protein YkvI
VEQGMNKKFKVGEETLGVSVMIIASITGVGFSSGQEMYQFFIRFGWASFISLLLFPLLVALFIFAFLYVSKTQNPKNYESILVPFECPPLRKMVDVVVTFFTSTIVVSMIAAAGTVTKQLFGFPTAIGSLICMLVLVMIILVDNQNIIAKFMRIVVPVFIACICLVCILSFFLPAHVSSEPVQKGNIISNWFTYGIIYISYNMLIIFGVLASLQDHLKSKRAVVFNAVFPPLVLFILLLLQFLSIIRQTSVEGIGVLPVPQIGKMIHPVFFYLYLTLLLMAACCAAISCFFSTYYRVLRIRAVAGIRRWLVTVVLAGLFYAASCVGFVNIVSYVFPFIGFLGLFILLFLMISFFRAVKKNRAAKITTTESKQFKKTK